MINAIGLFGVFLLIVDYYLLVSGKLLPTSIQYYLLNISASFCILFTLLFDFNLASIITQGIFIVIGFYGLIKNVFNSRKLRN